MNETYDHLFKFLIIGAAGTGKSCMLHHFLEGKFKANSSHTIGVEFGSKIVTVAGKSVKLQIWDTAGQERFRSVTRSYYRGAAAAVLVYDIANRESFNSLQNWLQDARTLASPNIVVVLAGNKKDLESQSREIPFLEASTFAQENELLFLECSALSGENIENVFLQCTRTVLSRLEQQQGGAGEGLGGPSGGFGLRAGAAGSRGPLARNLRTPTNGNETRPEEATTSGPCQC